MKSVLLFLTLLIPGVGFAQWTAINNGLADLSQGAMPLAHTETHLFTGTLAGGKMYSSTNNGDTWTAIPTPAAGFPVSSIYYKGKLITGHNAAIGCIYYTADNGGTWKEASGAPTASVVNGFTALGDDLFAFTSNKGVYKSTDGGLTWTAANSGLTAQNIFTLAAFNGKVFACTLGGVFVSADKGATWAAANSGIASGDLAGSFIWSMDKTLYFYTQGGGAYSSTNDGASWSTWTKPAWFGLGLIEVYRKNNHLYLETRHFVGGLKDSLYFSADEGKTWTNLTGNLLAADLAGTGLLEFNGNLFYRYTIGSTRGIFRRGVSVSAPEVQDLALNIHVFPNPVKEMLQITWVEEANPGKIALYNATGLLLWQSATGLKNALQLDMHTLPQGLYYLVAQGRSIKVLKE